MPLTAEQVEDLGADWAAAGAARRMWLVNAWKSPRKGKQIPPQDGDWQILLMMAGRGFGKMLDLTTPVPTPSGWTTMGDLRPGDRVFDEAGWPCGVTWVSDVTIPEVAYRVRFSDGSSLDACSEHQWVTWTSVDMKAFLQEPYQDKREFPVNWPSWRSEVDGIGPQVRTTQQIADTLWCKDGLNHCIPFAGIAPIQYRMIVGVDRIKSMPMRCITVDSPHSMYLAGRAMIPTHNTISQVQWAWWEDWRVPGIITHAIAPTLSDVRGTLFEGPAGFLATIPPECLLDQSVDKAYNKSLHELRLSNGSLIRGFGAQEEAGRLRGPQCHNLIADELREWEKPAGNLELAMTNALFGLRLAYPDGTPSRAVMGTTPKPIPFLKRFEKRAGVRVVRGSSYENIRNLAGVYRTTLLSLAGTQIGRQEIDGLYIDEESDLAILKRGWIRLWPKDPDTGKPRKLPEFSYILEVYDTAASEENFDKKKQTTDPSGSIVLGVFNVAQCFTEAERKKYRVRSKYACLLLDCWTERLGLPDLLERARAQHRTLWGPKGRGRRADMVLIENASSGPGLRQFMAKWGIPTWPYNPRIGKTMRVHGISPLVQQGMLWVPESGRPDRENLPIDWSEPFLEQICAFGGEGTTEHDEYVDCISAGFAYLRDRAVLEATPEVQFLDMDEKLDQDKAEAMEMADRERAREAVNPYGI